MRLSIITINYNNAEGLRRTAESVRHQQCRDYEWIVIDGGSTDASTDVIAEYADLAAYHTSEPDDGIYHAMNKGMERATGDYLQFLNSGDCLADDRVVADFIALGRDADLICADTNVVDADGRKVGAITSPDGISMLYFFNNNLNHQAVFFSRACLEGRRYDQRWRMCADRDLILRLLLDGASYSHWKRRAVDYDNTGLSSANSRKMKEESDRIMKELLPESVMADYRRFVQMRDVDLGIWVSQIMQSSRLVRQLARVVLYPVYLLSKRK